MKSVKLIGYIVFFIVFLFVAVLNSRKEEDVDTRDEINFLLPGIAYQPSSFEVGCEFSDKLVLDIKTDLSKIYSLGLRSIVTYSSLGNLAKIPQIAHEMGFDGTIIVGVWDPTNQDELLNALKHKSYVQGYCIGNEGLGIHYSRNELSTAIEWLREKSGKPVTTSERIERYLHGEESDFILKQSDFLLPLAHPYWANHQNTSDAVAWLEVHTNLLKALSGRQVYLKEVGFPSKCRFGCTEKMQLEFFQQLYNCNLNYFIFEAFDQPWKSTPNDSDIVEAHWGIMTEKRQEKLVTSWLNQKL